MKASEVLQLYQAGRRDFKHVNLRGQSFRKANLADADFSYADIRGTNFAQANLTGAKFINAKAGLQKHRRAFVITVFLLLLLVSALLTSCAGVFSIVVLSNRRIDYIIAAWLCLTIIVACYFFIFIKGIDGGNSIASLLSLITAYVVILVTVLSTIFDLVISTVLSIVACVVIDLTISIVLSVAFFVAIILIPDIVFSIVFTVVVYTALSISITPLIFKEFSLTAFALGIIICLSLVKIVSSVYLSYRIYRQDKRDAWLRSMGIPIAAIGGTNFSDANLTDADCSQATLKNTNFRNAKLIRTCFRNSKKLDFARAGGTILAATPVRKLLVDGNGFQQDYTKANLRGANLDDANLETAILKYADLSEASLVKANLQAANLTEAQAVGTNFTEARLTGACLEAWNIDSTTILEEIDCLWVYLAEKERENLNQWGERRPSSGEFKPGEFTKLFTEILDTVDLIFDKGIDWRAFVTAFKKAEAEENVSMHSIKNIGDGAIEVKLNVPPDADKKKIHSTFTQDYQLSLEAIKKEYEAKLAGKDRQIAIYREESARIERIVSSFASHQPNFINKTVMNDNTDQSQQLSVGGNFNIDANNAVVNLRDISGKVSNTINKLPETSNDATGIKELLTQLQTAIETETELTDKNKTKALKQVQKLAEAGESPQANQDDADDSLTMLKGIVSGLQETAKLVTTCQEIIPLLTGLFGL